MKKLALIIGFFLMAPPVHAQVPEPIQELIDAAQVALDGLDYESTIEIATTLLDTGTGGYPEIENHALQLLAAALYPEEEALQQKARAEDVLLRLIRTGPDTAMPRAISWPGLDSLMEQTRRGTLVVYAQPPAEVALHGVSAALVIPVQTTRSASIRIVASPRGSNTSILLAERAPDMDGPLFTTPFDPDGTFLMGGEYELAIEASEASGDRIETLRYDMTVEAPPLRLEAVPTAPLPASFLPEVSSGRTRRTLMIGAGVGVLTTVVAAVFRAESPTNTAAFDARAFAIGGTLSAATILGGWFGPGERIEANALHNARLRTTYETSSERIARDNEYRLDNYAARITIGPETH